VVTLHESHIASAAFERALEERADP
jgi:hypothetical protein